MWHLAFPDQPSLLCVSRATDVREAAGADRFLVHAGQAVLAADAGAPPALRMPVVLPGVRSSGTNVTSLLPVQPGAGRKGQNWHD